MHSSKLGGFIIDCNTDDVEQAAAFWSAALGMPIKARSQSSAAKYAELDSGARDLHVEVQTVSHASRVHLDIQSDNIEAEVERLEKLGAKRVAHVQTWWVMEAPTGQRFCVVRPQDERFAENAQQWE
jgi:predicted enzyme related to lactoylglutathione lyase